MPGTPEQTPNDAALASLVAAGDRAALEHLYRQHSGAVYRYGLAVCGNAAWAADATQEAFVQFAQRATGFTPGRGALAGYLCGIARFHLLSLLREPVAPHSDEPQDSAPPDADVADPAAEPLQMLVQRQTTAALLAAVRRLPLAFREAVVLVDLQERDYAQAAQIAAVPLNTLRTRLLRGRRLLAGMLAAHSNTAERKSHVLA